MGKKKSGPTASDEGRGNNGNCSSSSGKSKKAMGEATGPGPGSGSGSGLIICRNKHWRYISSFHGPWLQLPPEVLASLAHSNWHATRPRPIDAAVFFDVLKIRRLVDEATTLAVRANSGLGGSGSNNHHGHSLMGGGGGLLGMGYGQHGGGGGGTLSRERRYRMRELATGKLAAAYRLDEIAASVATMQSASSLEDVAALVLQRNPDDADARYVHFFHEKIPSRMMAQCTPLDALDALVVDRPADPSPLRTRALTRLFKDDLARSARDLTDALAAARCALAQHRRTRDQLVRANAANTANVPDRDATVPDDDQPSSLEAQLLFQRAGVYLSLACALVPAALDGLQQQETAAAIRDQQRAAGTDPVPETPVELDARLQRAESRRQLRQHAKRALRDYTAFLARFDYTPGLDAAAAEEFLRRYQFQSQVKSQPESQPQPQSPSALVPYKKPSAKPAAWPHLPPPPVFTLNQLFDAVPPSALPPYPLPPNTPPSRIPSHEGLTYHPLLPDALHSLLLVHALLQTPPKELLRHAHNAARLVRLLEGYPIFLAARSPARSDWVEVLRRGRNWIGLTGSWDKLCRPPASAEQNGHAANGTVARTGVNGARPTEKEESKEQRRERQKHEAILEALADERVVDEDSFQRAVRAREKRFRDDEKAEAAMERDLASTTSLAITNGTTPTAQPDPTPPKRWAQDESREYPISTERAEAVSRWLRDAPALTSENNTGKKKRRKGTRAVKGGTRLEESLASLALDE